MQQQTSVKWTNCYFQAIAMVSFDISRMYIASLN